MAAGGSRFDFAFITSAPFGELRELIQYGEALGYDGMWIPDQTFHRDPFALLSAAALTTERMHLGVGITSPFTRRPVQIARAAATIDEMSGGRFKLGLGSGNVAHVLTPLGISSAGTIRRLREAIQIMRALLRGETVDFESPHYMLRGVKLDFAPMRADIPIYLGTRGPETLALSGEIADGVLIESLFNEKGLSFAFEHIRKGAARASRSLNNFDAVSWQLIQVTDDVAAAVAARKPWMARKIRIGPASALETVGVKAAVIEAVNARLDDGDLEGAAAEVTDEAVQCAMIIGTPEEVAARITDIQRTEIASIGVLLLGEIDEVRYSLERFAREVLPLVHR